VVEQAAMFFRRRIRWVELVETETTRLLIQFFDLPIQPWTDRTLTKLGPLRSRRAGNIHAE
jgi:hypothetical protein